MKLKHIVSATLMAGSVLFASQASAFTIFSNTLDNFNGTYTDSAADPSGSGDASFTSGNSQGVDGTFVNVLITETEVDNGDGTFTDHYSITLNGTTDAYLAGASGSAITYSISLGSGSFTGGSISGGNSSFKYESDIYSDAFTTQTAALITPPAVGESSTATLSGHQLWVNSYINSGDDNQGFSFVTTFDVLHGAHTVPEPVSLSLFGLGLAAMGAARRRRSA